MVPVQFAWDFGDGETASEPEFEHLYVGPGLYDVTLNTWTLGWLHRPSYRQRCPIRWGNLAYTRLQICAIEPATVSLLDPHVEVVDHSQLAQEWSYQIEGRPLTTPSFDYMFDDAVGCNVMLTVAGGREFYGFDFTHSCFVDRPFCSRSRCVRSGMVMA